MEADRRHTTTGFKCHKSCLQSCLDLVELVVDGYPQALKRPGRDVDVAWPGLPWDRGLHRRGEVAGSAQRAPRHYELSDPARPSLFAVAPNDALDLRGLERIDNPFGGELRGYIHAHVERSVAAEAESALGGVELGAGDSEVEEDQIGLIEAGSFGNCAEVGEASVGHFGRGPKLGQRRLRGFDSGGIAVDPEQPAARNDSLQDQAGMARLPDRAVDRDCARFGLKQLYYLL